MRGDEKRIVDCFCAFLEGEGWRTEREVGFCDVVATRGEERIFAEAKGRTKAIGLGLDIDTLYGQLLRRMPIADLEGARFAVVVPDVAKSAAVRVPEQVRRLLAIDVYTVAEDGVVQCSPGLYSGAPDASYTATSSHYLPSTDCGSGASGLLVRPGSAKGRRAPTLT